MNFRSLLLGIGAAVLWILAVVGLAKYFDTRTKLERLETCYPGKPLMGEGVQVLCKDGERLWIAEIK